MSKPLPSLLPAPSGPKFVPPVSGLSAELTPQQVNRQLREVFREAFDTLGGPVWLVEFATKNDQNARVFVQAISKLLPPQNDAKQQGGVIIDVPWLTSTRLAYKRNGDNEVVDVQICDSGARVE
jgi:hypothetical protein